MLVHDWKKFPLKFDPNRGYMLCRPCWDGQHVNPAFRDALGVMKPQTSNCLLSKYKGLGGCECGCTSPKPKEVKFAGEGQTEISMEDFLIIGPEADKLRNQIEVLKKK